MMQLRDYQVDAVEAACESLDAGKSTLLLKATGTGKTEVFTEVVRRRLPKGRAMIVANRDILVRQTAERMRKNLGVEVDIEMAEQRANHGMFRAPIVVSSIQTLASGREQKRYQAFDRTEFKTLVIDECFPAGTLVDGRPIESFRVGDETTFGRVKRIFRNPANSVLRLRFNSGRELVCTAGHPIFNGHDFIPAALLTLGDVVLTITNHEKMRAVWSGHASRRTEADVLEILRGGASVGNDGAHESEACFGEDEGEQPNEAGRRSRFGFNETQGDGVEANRSAWQRARPDNPRTGHCVGAWLGNKRRHQNRRSSQQQNVSNMLQGGCWKQGLDGRNRGGWELTRNSFATSTGQEERGVFAFDRLDGIEIHQQGNSKEFERLCPGGFVYNLEIERSHVYVANDIVVHNCHHAAAVTYSDVIGHFRSAGCGILGVTATGDRHDKIGLGGQFDCVAFRFPISEAILEGWLVPVKWKALDVTVDLSGVSISLGDFNGQELRDALAYQDTLEQIASDVARQREGRPTILFADSVANAERITEALLRLEPNSARIITGETPRDERADIVAGYAAGAFGVLVNVGVATEGFDAPHCACVALCRPTRSRSLYEQMLGRGTRPLRGVVDGPPTAAERRAAISASGKPDLLILDLVHVTTEHQLVTAFDVLAGDADADVVAKARASGESDVRKALEDAQAAQNAELAARAAAMGKLLLRPPSKTREIDPFFAFGLPRPAVADMRGELTATSREKLERWKLWHDGMDEATAQAVIAEMRRRTRAGLATPAQMKWLESRCAMSHEEALCVPFVRARALLDAVAANKWKPLGRRVVEAIR